MMKSGNTSFCEEETCAALFANSRTDFLVTKESLVPAFRHLVLHPLIEYVVAKREVEANTTMISNKKATFFIFVGFI
jgi:hypothetical protein